MKKDGSYVKTQCVMLEIPFFVQFRLVLNSLAIQSTCVIEAGLSDFQLMASTIMRKTFKKLRPGIMNYGSIKYFSNEDFRESLVDRLSNQICDALRNLVAFVQFKKREKHP